MPFVCVDPSFSFSRDQVAVAISHGAFGGHIGLAFHAENEGARLLHLRFHQDLKVEEFPPAMPCWIAVAVNLPLQTSRHLVGMVRYVAKQLPSINFGVNFIVAKGSFLPTGQYSPPAGSLGLTCATFITEIFRASGLTLISEGTWQPVPDNQEWVGEVITGLKRRGATESHVWAVSLSFRGLRVRPEEVGGAASAPFAQWPLDFNAARATVAPVRQVLNACCSPKRSIIDAVGKALLSLVPFPLPYKNKK
jgi:hypothetical protein